LRIYIASPYIAQQEFNKVLYDKLRNTGNEVFLPMNINIDAITEDDKKLVAEICYSEIDKSDIVLIVYPFGISVACEAGYCICQKVNGNRRKIILYNNIRSDKLYNEAMFIPYIDFETDRIEDLINYIDEL
jgi:nucleoside 2-deoxyribosyltransferase